MWSTNIGLSWMLIASSMANVADDQITSLPEYGNIAGTQYSGMLPISENKNLFYWFVESAEGNKQGITPLLIWMNGGPGASSLTGLLTENIGPIALKGNKTKVTLTDNQYAWSNKHHVLAIDNPVGAGFSYTSNKGYVTNEEEMRRDYYRGLSMFMEKHAEYQSNPIWVTGESYGGKYVPNVAWAIHTGKKFNLQGVIIGNGMLNPAIQYQTIPDYAFNQGIIDEHVYRLTTEEMGKCVHLIVSKQNAEAFKFCEAVVDWMYGSSEAGAGQFYYDLGMADGSFFDHLTEALGTWLNNNDVREAIHAGNHTWVQADEKGPVADALSGDFVSDQATAVVAQLLAVKSYHIVYYNGVRDGSMCNHVGNVKSLNALEWDGELGWRKSGNKPFKVGGEVAGFVRNHENLSYYTLLRTGHLVPIAVPNVALALIETIVDAGTVRI